MVHLPRPLNQNHSEQSKVILVVEDDFDIADIIESYLKREGLKIIRVVNGKQALEVHASHPVDLVLLDVQLPELNGWEVLASIRYHSTTPVIMLTALDQDVDKIMALRVGADDYVVKPFNPNELVARVQAVLRRSQTQQKSTPQHLRYKNIEIHLENHSAYIYQGEKRHQLTLTLTEYKILVLLLAAPHKVFTRTELLERCLPEGDALERTVDSHVSKLRKKMEDLQVNDLFIGVRGVGYRLDKNL